VGTFWIGKGICMSIRIGPAETARAVTPSDTTTIGGARALWVGGAGNLTLDFADGQTNVLFSGVPAGTLLPVAPLKVKAASTATLIVALY
jgi:hypothetical protein